MHDLNLRDLQNWLTVNQRDSLKCIIPGTM